MPAPTPPTIPPTYSIGGLTPNTKFNLLLWNAGGDGADSIVGTLTANGEGYRQKRLTAAHLTLPLGTWVELKARATGKSIRVRVNDRGPYVKKFAIDLSRAAARALGVDLAEDRWVDIRIIALPGEEPLPEGVLTAAAP